MGARAEALGLGGPSVVDAPPQAPTARRHEPRGRVLAGRDGAIVASLCVLAIVVPALVALAAGSFFLPSIDDWAYRRTAETFAQTGSLQFTGYSAMTLLGQVLWSWPFLRLLGTGGWGFAVSTGVLAAIGVASAYSIGRTLLGRRSAAAAVVVLILAPGFAWNTSTFMTDVPTTSSELACLALGIAAVARRGRARWALLLGSLAVGVFGFTIREFALAAPVAVLVCASVGDSRRARSKYVVAGLVLLAVCLAIYRWWLGVPGGHHQPLLVPSTISLVRLVEGYFTLSFMVSPAIGVAAWRRWRGMVPRRAVLGAALAVLLGVAADRSGGSVFVGDFLVRNGAVGALLLDGARPALFPAGLWDLISVVGLGAGGVLAGLALDGARGLRGRWRSWEWAGPRGAIRIFAILFALGSALYVISTSVLWDRYLWPLAFALALLLLATRPVTPSRRRWAWTAGGSLWALLVLVAVALALNTDGYAAARWRAGEVAVAAGIPARSVDAGFEWVGAHSRGVADEALRPAAPSYEPWYARMQPGFRECAVVSGSPLADPGLRAIGTKRYALYAFAGPSEPLYVYRVTGCRTTPQGVG